ncbi:hypothetical protein [Neorhizobium sp. JUb45]|uniref:hypothetical protein n=1 Tax=unclassified Neorhizobium TaxID=2629175 RepID=UPI0014053EC8|nr:hypothetical protein [Neorhizobium sp. JUb45]
MIGIAAAPGATEVASMAAATPKIETVFISMVMGYLHRLIDRKFIAAEFVRYRLNRALTKRLPWNCPFNETTRRNIMLRPGHVFTASCHGFY